MQKYSQNNEQDFIMDYFGSYTEGKFMDIGAYNPFKFSNTRCLYEIGFSGVIVEPSKICFENFVKEYAEDGSIVMLNYAVSDTDGVLKFYESNGDAVSTTDDSHKAKWENGSNVKFNEVSVPAMGMQRLVDVYGSDVDFLSLDTESTNLKLFNLLPDFFLRRLKGICIEHDSHQVQMMEKLSQYGFKQHHVNNENLVAFK